MKIIQISTNFAWKITAPTPTSPMYVGVCSRLELTIQGHDLEELSCNIQDAINFLFIDLYETNDLNEFCFDHSIAYKVEESDGKLINVSPGTVFINE